MPRQGSRGNKPITSSRPVTRSSKIAAVSEEVISEGGVDTPKETPIDASNYHSSQAIRDAIAHEREQEFMQRVESARRKHTARPQDLPANWDNPRIAALRKQLDILEASEKGLKTPPSEMPVQNAVSGPPIDTPASNTNLPAVPTDAAATSKISPTVVSSTILAPDSLNTTKVNTHDMMNAADKETMPSTDIDGQDGQNITDKPLAFKEPVEGNGVDDDSDIRRPGALSWMQLAEIQAKAKEIKDWIAQAARQMGVSPVTISTNMGLDDRERRATSFWNKFQTVFYARLAESLAMKQEAGPEDEDVDLPTIESARQDCKTAYAFFKNMSELPDNEREKLETEQAKILAEYEEMQSPDNAAYKEGSTQNLMKAACKDFTTRALWFGAKGVAIGGWIISLDPHDPTASACNMMFAGSDSMKKFLESRKVNMRGLMYDLETVCRGYELEERETAEQSLDQIWAAHKDSSDRRRSRSSDMLKQIWANAMKKKSKYHLRWHQWADDMLEEQLTTVGWPDQVPHPSGDDQWKVFEKVKFNKPLWDALCGKSETPIKIIPWNDEQKKLAKDHSHLKLRDMEEWRSIPLVQSVSGDCLVSIGTLIEREQNEKHDQNQKHKRAKLEQNRSETASNPGSDQEEV